MLPDRAPSDDRQTTARPNIHGGRKEKFEGVPDISNIHRGEQRGRDSTGQRRNCNWK